MKMKVGDGPHRRLVKWFTVGIGLAAGAVMATWVLGASPASAADTAKPPALEFPWQTNLVHRISGSGYDCNTHHNTGAQNTFGLDFDFGTIGTPVTASAAGTASAFTDSAGALIIDVDHGGGWRTEYVHLNSYAITIQNQWVGQGQVIGYSGNTGMSTGPHLHFALLDRNGASHPPEPMFGPYRGGDSGFGAYGTGTGNGKACSGVISPGYTAKIACPTGSSQSMLNRAPTDGVYTVAQDGGVFAFGHAPFRGSMGGQALNSYMTGIQRTYDNSGYWEVGADGGIFAFGAPFQGGTGGLNLVACIQGMAARPDSGYWLVAADGGIFAYPSSTPFYGSMGGYALNAPIVGMAATPTGNGYLEVGQDGGIFAFGDAPYVGSLSGGLATAPVTGVAITPSNRGYWIVQANGTVVAFGDAVNYGSDTSPTAPVVTIQPTVNGDGYWLIQSDGIIVEKGSAEYVGGLFGQINGPVNGSAGLHGMPPGLTVTATPPVTAVFPGTSGNVTIMVAANPYFQGTASLSASGAPSGISVSFSPGSVGLIRTGPRSQR
ncbi:MAG TPA: M23 family metallopeptidase [Acidimicrobiales bacterium]|nr:M23 family metallopeptidase [Acidimicrobiales bacterium]